MSKLSLVSIVLCSSSLLFSSAALSAAQKKDAEEESVHSWGPWNGVQTAAGPGVSGNNLPLSLSFVDAQNATDGSAFEAGVDTVVDNAGPREYHVYHKRGEYEQAFFESLVITDNINNKKDQVQFSVVTESGEIISVGMRQRRAVGEYSAIFEKKNKGFWQITVPETDGVTPAFYLGFWEKKQRKNVWHKGSFVYGDSSSIDAVLALPQGIEQNAALANYSGFFLNGGNVDITIDFSGSGSWVGQFDMDGNGFDVTSGSINGVDLVGDAVGDSVVAGQVEASFFGSKAQFINGIADVDFGDEQIMDTFVSGNANAE
ncbi:hypothetical protein [Neptuniibacter sp. QD34_54]|uniref:hypothetical protein n=1 Tax=Neptuniibacter sp. QD34_54 TaxID=3398208 RepID=UPI0039F64724